MKNIIKTLSGTSLEGQYYFFSTAWNSFLDNIFRWRALMENVREISESNKVRRKKDFKQKEKYVTSFCLTVLE